MNSKKLYLIFVATILCTTNLLNGMSQDIFDLSDLNKFYKTEQNLYGQEIRKLDLSNQKITVDFLSKNQIPLQKFIETNKIQILDLQRNNLKEIPVCILKILLETGSSLKEINIISPKLSVGQHKTIFAIDFYDVNKILEKIKTCDSNIEIYSFTENKNQSELKAYKIIKIDENQTLYLIKK